MPGSCPTRGTWGREHLGRLADPEADTPVIATTSKLLSTGVDIPTARNIVLFKPIGSIVEFKQIIGRGTRLYPDPGSGRLVLVEYGDYVAGEIRRLFAGASDLRASWRTQRGRDEVVEALRGRGIAFEEIAERLGMPEADPFDLLVHVACDAPVTTRRERVGRVRRDQEEFFASLRPGAREVLDALLEKYAEAGPSELSLDVLKAPPLTEFGTPVEIAKRFGGTQSLREAVDRFQAMLYAA